MKFRKKSLVIEAVPFDIRNCNFLIDWAGIYCSGDECSKTWYIPTLEGDMRLSPGDWIIKGIKGEFYPCKPDIFEATYESVEDSK